MVLFGFRREIPSLSIDTASAVPIPAQLREIFLEEIRQGRFEDSKKVPSERALAERYGVSRTSVRESLNTMVREGLLVRRVGKGTFVAGDGRDPAEQQFASIAFLIGENIFRFVRPGYNRILLGAQEACRQAGFQLLFHAVPEEESDPSLHFLETAGTELRAWIVTGGLHHRAIDRILQSPLPVVFVDLLVDDEKSSFVGFDYATGTRLAMEHLAELGHERIGFIGFANSEKYEAYWRTLEQLGLRYDPHLVKFLQLPDVQPSISSGFRMMQQMVASERLPTAVLATNDLVAVGVMEALTVAGIRVPQQMSVIGFDDLGQEVDPPLTTVRSDVEGAGRLAATYLIERLRVGEQKEPRKIVVPTELIVRGTTAPPGGDSD